MDVAKIRILIEANSDAVRRGLSPGIAAVTAFERATTGSLKKVQSAFAGLSGAQKGLIGLGVGLGALALGMVATVGPAIAFESAFAGVRKTVDGTPEQLNRIREEILGLSQVIPTAATDLASIAENAGQLGVSAGQVVEFTRVVAILGETTDLDFDTAAQSLARFLNITGAGAGEIESVADVIVELGNNSATTESQIVAFSTRLAASFTAAGATEDQILAVASAFSSMGVEAEAGGSALSRIITQIADAAKIGGQDLAIFARVAGLLPEEFAAIAAANPVEALLLFEEGLKGIIDSGGAITPILEDLGLGGIRVRRALELGALGVDLFRGQLDLAATALEEGGAAAEEFAKRTETTASRLTLLQLRLTALAITLGTPLLGTIAAGADTAGDAITRLAQILGPLASALRATFANGAALVEAFFGAFGSGNASTALFALEALVELVATVISGFNALGPAGLVAAGFVAVLLPIGPLSLTAATGMGRLLAVSSAATGVFAATAAAARGLLLALGPVGIAAVVLTGAFLSARAETKRLEAAAEAAGKAIESTLGAALASQDFGTFNTQLAETTAEIQRLEQVLREAQESITGGTGEGRLQLVDGAELSEQLQLIQRTTIEIEALQEALRESGAEQFAFKMEILTEQFGLSERAVIGAAEATGTLNDLVEGGAGGYGTAAAAIRRYLTELENATAATIEQSNAILDGTATIEDYATLLEITADNLLFVSERIDGVNIEDLFSDDDVARTQAFDRVLAELADRFAPMAEAIGVTTNELLNQLGAVDALADSHDRLRQTVDGTLSAMEAMAAQQRITAEATDEFALALDAIGEDGGIIAAATAMRLLTAETAALTGSAEAAKAKQDELFTALLNAADAAGLSREEVFGLVTQLGLLPDAALIEIALESEKAQADVAIMQALLDDVATEYIATLIANDLASQIILENQGFIDLFPGTYLADMVAVDSASINIIPPTLLAEAFATGDWTAVLKAIDEASGLIDTTRSDAQNYAAGPYDAGLVAHDAGAAAATSVARSDAQNYAAGAYSASLTADSSQARAEINRAVQALASFQNKAITITTNHRTSRQFATGGITAYATGGIGGVAERPGRAQIYSPATPYRVFAEPQTGGEAYIPFRGDHGRNVDIWRETGRLLGVLATGGIQAASAFQAGGVSSGSIPIVRAPTATATQITISAPITVEIGNAGAMTPEEVEATVTAGVARGLAAAVRDLDNVRLSI